MAAQRVTTQPYWMARPSRRRRPRASLLAALVFAAMLSAVVRSHAVQIAPNEAGQSLLDAATGYVDDLEIQLGAIISHESSHQRVDSWEGRTIASRQLESERLLWWFADEHVWLSIRNVLAVDSRPIPDSKQRLDGILASTAPGTVSRLRALQQEGARFDVGSVLRTTSSPTLALQFLAHGARDRFSFSPAGGERLRGFEVQKLSFLERHAPTVVTIDGEDALAAGQFWIRVADGTVVRTTVRLNNDKVTATITVDFAPNAKLGLWVPDRMTEDYQRRVSETITVDSAFSDYRRFETSGRLIQPQ